MAEPFKRGSRWAGVVDIAPDPVTGRRRQQWGKSRQPNCALLRWKAPRIPARFLSIRTA